MRDWKKLSTVTYCGKCAAAIPVGDPVLVMSGERFSKPKFRCADCEGPAPDELRETVVFDQPSSGPVKLGDFMQTADAWKPFKE